MRKTIISHFLTTVNFDIFKLSFLWFFALLARKNKEDDLIKLEKNLENYIWGGKIFSFYNARTALFCALEAVKSTEKNEVLVCWYTCMSVIHPILDSSFKPVYVDINKDTLNCDFSSIEVKITPKTKAIIVQHTFWNPAEIEKIVSFAKEKNIVIIEDLAHALWWDFWWKKLGSFGDFSIISFGRDKVISSISWGFLSVNNSAYIDKISALYKKFEQPYNSLIYSNFTYGILSFLAKKSYDFFWIWRLIMKIANKLKLFPAILTKWELEYSWKNFNKKYSSYLAKIWLTELKKLDIYNAHRKKIANFYRKNLENLYNFQQINQNWKNVDYYLAIKEKNIILLKDFAKKNWILLWDYWSYRNIVPQKWNIEKWEYQLWDCKNAEEVSKEILILPNHYSISLDDAKKVTNTLKKYKNITNN